MLKNLIQSFFQKYGKKVSKKLADLKRDLDAGSKMHMPVTSRDPALSDLNLACGRTLDFLALASCTEEKLSTKLSNNNDFCDKSVEAKYSGSYSHKSWTGVSRCGHLLKTLNPTFD